MLHLLKGAVDPGLSLKECLEDWHGISCALRESSRERVLQVERFDDEG